MDGIHDLGGMEGFGPIEIEPGEPTFHEAWHGRAFALNAIAIGILAAYNTDAYRHAVERLRPLHYLDAHYYERVLTAVATLLVETGRVDHADLERRAGGRFPLAQPGATITSGELPAPRDACYSVGDRVRVHAATFRGHTRAPRYVRGQTGVVLHVTPPFPLPDASAHGFEARSEATYHVEFDAQALWGPASEADASVVVDLWESYLEPAS